MKKYKLYLFDFDGTLLNTTAALEFVFSVAYAHIGLKFNPEDAMEFARIPLEVGYKRMNGKQADWMEFALYLEKALDFPEALERNSPYEESYEFFDYIRKNNIHAGIVTSNKVSHVKDVLNVLDIPLETFNIYVGNKEYKKFKPHPDPIMKALEVCEKGYLPHEVVYVGDGINDTISANAAGVDAVLIDRKGEYPESDQYVKITSLLDLFK